MRCIWSWNNKRKAKRKSACAMFAERFVPPLFTLTELRAITVTTFNPPTSPLNEVAIPKARRSLLTFERRFSGSSLSTALMLSKVSILAISVIEKTVEMKGPVNRMLKSGKGKFPKTFSGRRIIKFSATG